MGGGILYNKKVFDQVGLQVPKTWAEFESNNEKLKAAGSRAGRRDLRRTTPGHRSCSSSRTTATCRSAVPDFATKYTDNQAKYADTPAAQAGFQHLAGGLREGLVAAGLRRRKFDDGINMLAEGKIAQYPMLTFAALNHRRRTIPTRSTTSASSASRATTPRRTARRSGCRPPRTSPRRPSTLDEAKLFQSIHGVEGRHGRHHGGRRPGRSVRDQGRRPPANVLPAVNDIQAYIDVGQQHPGTRVPVAHQGPVARADHRGGRLRPDLRRGWRQRSTTLTSPKQAQQLGLPGW